VCTYVYIHDVSQEASLCKLTNSKGGGCWGGENNIHRPKLPQGIAQPKPDTSLWV